jgi:hypothetical protein
MDHAEGAFSMEVPVSWQVEGGTYRFGYFDVRRTMYIGYLDGQVIVVSGIPTCRGAFFAARTRPAGHPSFARHVPDGGGQLSRQVLLRTPSFRPCLHVLDAYQLRLEPDHAARGGRSCRRCE